jgi:uncharacterized protein YgiM (DUF1202 family)
MASIESNRRLFAWVLWIFAGLALVVLLTSCSPLAINDSIPTATPSAQPSPIIATVSTNSPETCKVATGIETGVLNLRTGSGTNYSVIQTLAEGEVLTIITRGNWLQVATSQHVTGWVNSHYCKIGE